MIDRPWKLPAHTMISARSAGMPLILWPHLRAALSAVSTASAPPLAGSARSSPVSVVSRLQEGRQKLVVEDARGDGEPLRLLDQRAHDARMRVAVAHGRVRAHHVEVAAAVLVPQPAAVAVRQNDRQRVVVARGVAALARDRRGDCRGADGRRRAGGETAVHADAPCESRVLSLDESRRRARSAAGSWPRLKRWRLTEKQRRDRPGTRREFYRRSRKKACCTAPIGTAVDAPAAAVTSRARCSRRRASPHRSAPSRTAGRPPCRSSPSGRRTRCCRTSSRPRRSSRPSRCRPSCR